MRARLLLTALAVIGIASACVEPPPKIESIPPSGLSLRVHVFGASAEEARRAFKAARQNNKNFSLVQEGGDGEVLVGLENDSPKCVAPTALCSYKVAFRIRDNAGKIVHSEVTAATANAERCADLCERARTALVVKVIEAAVVALKASGAEAAHEPAEGEEREADAGDATASPAKKAAMAPDASAPAKGEPAICAVGRGPQLAAEEAERRAAQVEVLKRIAVLDQDEYDCLRKAYLDRL